jgi:Tol biopolymer transport system component/predicted Ser/Thr protein kinase
MALIPGARLGPYEIVSAIGAGGMGEVYRARDPRLGRDVAIKVSAESFSDRFEREARAVAILNHPNICTLHDVGPNYLVMEYIDGAPLTGPLPLAQALKYATQICEALDAAHRKQVVHRDLKPGNILVTKSGIKVLDFGLARMGAPVTMNEATLTKALTAKGEILGTLHYMSPEQLQGHEAEAPSDIFSFGLVLYEMLTGKRAFDGPSPASVIAAILERPAPSVGEIGSPALDRVLHRCLEKDPESRWQSARDLRNELEWIATAPASAATTSRSARHRIAASLGWIAASVLAIALAIMLGTLRRSAPESPPITFELNPPDGDIFGGGFPVISPDGRVIAASVFHGAGQRRIAVRRLDTPVWQPLAGTEGAFTPAWSPDGRYLAFLAGTKVKKIDLTGGPPQPVADVPGGWIPYIAWNRHGVILFSRLDGLWKVSDAGGNPSQVTALDPSIGENLNGAPQFLPDGHHFLFLGRNPGDDKSAVYVASIDASGATNRTRLFAAASSPVYAESARGAGYLLFEREGALMAQPFDVEHARLTGDPFLVAPKVGLGGSALAASVSQTAVLVLSTAPTNVVTMQLAWFDRTGKAVGELGVPGIYLDFSLAPDGKHVMVARAMTGNRDLNLWLVDVATSGMTRFKFDAATNRSPVWSPDGSRLVYTRSQSDLYEKVVGGTGERRLNGVLGIPMDWSRDGHSILVRSNDGDLWALIDGTPIRITQTPFNETLAQFSPDGKWIAFVSNEGREPEVYVQPFPSGGEKFSISIAGGTQPRWRGDGAELFYVALDGKLMAVAVKTNAGFEHSAPTPLFDIQLNDGLPNSFDYLVSGDGQRFLVRTPARGTRTSPVMVMTNWLALAKSPPTP